MRPYRAQALGLVCICLLLTGCAGRQRNKNWDNHNSYLRLVEKQLQETTTLPVCPSSQNWLEQYYCLADAPSPDQKKLANLRNRILEMYIQLADQDYARFEKSFNNQRAVISTTGDFVGLALTGAGSAVANLATQFSAAATGVQGAKHSFEKNFYDAQTRFVITSKMQALRKEVLTRIRAGQLMTADCGAPPATPPVGSPCYTLEQGMNDVQEYFHAGTVHRALDSISATTAAQSKDADAKLKILMSAPASIK